MMDNLSKTNVLMQRSLPKKIEEGIKSAFGVGVDGLLLLAAVSVIGLFQLRFPHPSNVLDNSWPLAISIAAANDMLFGKHILFQLGPLSEIYTHYYHPVTIQWVFPLSLLLGCCFGIGLLVIIPRYKWGLKLWMIFSVGAILILPDSILMVFPVLLGVFIYSTRLGTQLNFKRPNWIWWIQLIIFLIPIGILPLVKGTLLTTALSAILLSVAVLVWKKETLPAIIVLTIPLLVCSLLWMGLGYPFIELFRYIKGSTQMVAGYSEAMSIGSFFDYKTGLYIIGCTAILSFIFFLGGGLTMRNLYLLTIFALYLFLSFKGSFVRYDVHPLFYGLSILFALIIALSIFESKFNPILAGIVVFVYLTIDKDLHNSSVQSIFNSLDKTISVWKAPGINLFNQKDLLDQRYEEGMAAIHSKFNLEQVDGTADIYNYNTMALLASDNTWNPRPVFQSFAAYNEQLASLNKNHLLSENAPDYLFFKFETIDNRYPTLDDGMSWPVFFSRYSPYKYANEDYILLKKKEEWTPDPNRTSIIQEHQGLFTDRFAVPVSDDPVFAEIHIEKSLVGKLMALLFKLPELNLTVHSLGGRTIKKRIIAPVAAAGFIISPYVTTPEGFSLLFDANYSGGESRTAWFELSTSLPILWKQDVSVTYKGIKRDSHFNIHQIKGQKKGLPGIPHSQIPENFSDAPPSFDGHIDLINGQLTQTNHDIYGNTLSLKGWLAHSPGDGLPGQDILMVLTSEDGQQFCYRTQADTRPDVANHFNQPGLINSGFTAVMDVADLRGSFSLSLTYQFDGEYYLVNFQDLHLEIHH